MPVFDVKQLDHESEGQALLGAILHPSRAARVRAIRAGRDRLENNPFRVAPSVLEPGLPMTGNDLAPVVSPQP